MARSAVDHAAPRIGLLARGDRTTGGQSARAQTRLAPLVRACSDLGAAVEPVVYFDDAVDAVREQLLGLDGVLVWVNPVQDGVNRSQLDALLREVAGCGVWVSADPDVVLKMGTKQVLYATRNLGWGTDVELYPSLLDFTQRFPVRLARERVLVLKQGRGTGGSGVWRVELTERDIGSQPDRALGLDAPVRVQHAATKDHAGDEMPLGAFLEHCRGYFDWSGFLVDQPFQTRLPDGMIRAYLVHDEVVGFLHQWPTGLLNPRASSKVNPPPVRGMEDPDTPAYQRLRASLNEWIPQMTSVLGLHSAELPVIWDADFLYGPTTPSGEDSYVLCEINVSAVWPFPAQAANTIAQAGLARLHRTATARG